MHESLVHAESAQSTTNHYVIHMHAVHTHTHATHTQTNITLGYK